MSLPPAKGEGGSVDRTGSFLAWPLVRRPDESALCCRFLPGNRDGIAGGPLRTNRRHFPPPPPTPSPGNNSWKSSIRRTHGSRCRGRHGRQNPPLLHDRMNRRCLTAPKVCAAPPRRDGLFYVGCYWSVLISRPWEAWALGSICSRVSSCSIRSGPPRLP